MFDPLNPEAFTLLDGNIDDYRTLQRFHYRARRPATWCRVVAARFAWPGRAAPVTVAVGVLSWPTACSRGRQRAFAMNGWTYGEQLLFANANIRTISRVIVHPTFRSLGLSTRIIRRLIELCPTRYVEAAAVMGRAHPLFEKAGMTRFDPTGDRDPVYYLFDKSPPNPAAEARGSDPECGMNSG